MKMKRIGILALALAMLLAFQTASMGAFAEPEGSETPDTLTEQPEETTGALGAGEGEEACTHPSTEWVADYNSEYRDAGDGEGHYRYQTGTRTKYCTVCGEELETEQITPTEGWVSEYEEHFYDDDGVCYNCGYVRQGAPEPTEAPQEDESEESLDPNTCEHKNVDFIDYDWDSVTYAPIDNNEHSATLAVTEVFCNDCRNFLEGDFGVQTMEWAHNYDANGVCEDCGHVNTCAHEHTSEDLYTGDGWNYYKPLNEQEHNVIGQLTYEVWCNDCGQQISETVKEYSAEDPVSEPHSFNSIGVCARCGYHCPHPDKQWILTGEDDALTYRDAKDGRGHYTYRAMVRRIQECTLCSKMFGVEKSTLQDGWINSYEEHEYDDAGVCTLCGFANPDGASKDDCKHENQEPIDYDYESATYAPIDNGKHSVTARVAMMYCLDCDRIIEGDFGVMTMERVHSYSPDGVCSECKHVNTCNHENTQEVWHSGSDMNYFKPIDEHEHYVVGEVYFYDWCKDCWQSLNVRMEYYPASNPFRDEHVFGAGDVCYNCGYKRNSEIEPDPTEKPVEPGKTAEPTKKPDSGNKGASKSAPKNDVPKTGEDTRGVALCLALMALAATALVLNRRRAR